MLEVSGLNIRYGKSHGEQGEAGLPLLTPSRRAWSGWPEGQLKRPGKAGPTRNATAEVKVF